MAAAEKREFRVVIAGIELTPVVGSVLIKPETGEVLIDLKEELRSENGSAHRHLKGLQKAKN